MTIASFHQQVYVESADSGLEKLKVLRDAPALRDQLSATSASVFRYWFIWP